MRSFPTNLSEIYVTSAKKGREAKNVDTFSYKNKIDVFLNDVSLVTPLANSIFGAPLGILWIFYGNHFYWVFSRANLKSVVHD